VAEISALVHSAEAKHTGAQAQLKELAMQNSEQINKLKSEVKHLVQNGKELLTKTEANAARVAEMEKRLAALEAKHSPSSHSSSHWHSK